MQRQVAKHQNLQELSLQLLQKQELSKLNDKDFLAQQIANQTNMAKQMEEAELMRKRMQKQTYKEMLDQQLAARQLIKMHGNMTEVEKRMNKDDLIAWKNFDNNQYSLIPGVSNTKKVLDRS